MKKVVIISKDKTFPLIFKNFFEANFKVRVDIILDTNNLSDKLINISPDMIMTCDNTSKGELKSFTEKILTSLSKDIPLFSINGSDFYAEYKCSESPESLDLSKIKDKVSEVVDLDDAKEESFYEILIENFYLLTEPCCDIYIKISKPTGAEFVKRINAGDQVDKDAIKKYQAMNLTHFYVEYDDYERIMEQILSTSLRSLIDANQSGQDTMEVTADSFEITQNLLDELGVKPMTVRVARAAMKSMMKSVSGDKKLTILLKDILNNESSYSFKRSYLIMLFFNEILPFLGWGSGAQMEQTLEKITFVSFFHDCCLRDEHLLKINSKDDLVNSDLTDIDYALIDHHANKAATLVQSVPNTPPGVDVIIRQHHGSPNGVGFCEKYTNSISPVAIVFIVVESYVTEILNTLYDGRKPSNSEIFAFLDDEFPLPSYRKIVGLLKNMSMAKKK